MSSRFQKIRGCAALSLILALGLTGCSRDRDTDDYRKEKVLEELARLNTISGTYTGELKSRATGEKLGNISVQLQADTTADRTPDGTRTEERPVLRTRVSYIGQHPLTLVFSAASYDSTANTIKSQSAVTKTDKTVYQVDLIGVIKGDSLEGSIQAFGYPENAAVFVANKGVQPTEQGDLPPDFREFNQSYIGSTVTSANGTQISPRLRILSNPLSREEEFLELVLPIRNVRATLSLGLNAEVVFSQARWDEQTGNLQGIAELGTSDIKTNILLKCHQTNIPGLQIPGWSCDYSSSITQGTHTVAFTPSDDANQLQPAPPPQKNFYFKGFAELPLTGKKQINLALTYRPPTREEELLEYFADIKVIRATMNLSRDVQIVFDNALWYFENGRLTAKTTVQVQNRPMDILLECSGARGTQAGSSQPWNCSYTTSFKSTPQAVRFEPLPPGKSPDFSGDPVFRLYSNGAAKLPSGENRSIQLNLQSMEQTKEEQMEDYFLYTRQMRATLALSRNVQIVFSNSSWNRETGLLRGETDLSVDGEPVHFSLECSGVRLGNSGWNCQYRTSLRSNPTFVTFAPQSSPVSPAPTPAPKEEYMRGEADLPTWGKRPVNVSFVTRSPTREQELLQYFKAIYTMRVTLTFSQNVQVVFENAEWNLDQSTLKAEMNLQSSGQNLTLVLECIDQNGSRGGNPNWTCQYTTGLRDESVNIRINQKGARNAPLPAPLPPFEQDYIAKEAGQEDLWVHMGTRALTKDQEYYEFFRFVRILRVSLRFAPDVTIVFDAAEWSHETHNIIAKTKTSYGGQQADLSLECYETSAPNAKPPLWNCSYTSSLQGLVANLQLIPGKPTPQ